MVFRKSPRYPMGTLRTAPRQLNIAMKAISRVTYLKIIHTKENNEIKEGSGFTKKVTINCEETLSSSLNLKC